MGSGTSAIAAMNCGLDWVGFDIDADYRAFAQDRIAAHIV
jgi:DNA modification methylase